MRLRITFSKNEWMRFTGHLDLHRAWERIFRRAALPIAYSQGFSPHPRIQLASALPLGFTSQAELVDVWLEEELPLDQIAKALAKAIPPGIQINEIQSVEQRLPSLQSSLEASEFVVAFLDEQPDLQEAVQRLLQADNLPRIRRKKPYDLRPLILELEMLPASEVGQSELRMLLAAKEGATGRPEEVLECLGIAPTSCRVHRTALLFATG
jgi:radical SAM-linked protein